MAAREARRFPFVQVDVFTSRPLEGNPLAVFTDARGLSAAEMQAIARETNLSETTFVLAAPGGGPPRVRIFTVEEELPFAGHPTLGTAAVLRGAGGAATVTLELGVGAIPVAFTDGADGAFGEMRQRVTGLAERRGDDDAARIEHAHARQRPHDRALEQRRDPGDRPR